MVVIGHLSMAFEKISYSHRDNHSWLVKGDSTFMKLILRSAGHNPPAQRSSLLKPSYLSTLRSHHLLENSNPACPAPAPLTKDVHWNCHHTNEDVDPADYREYLFWPLLRNPIRDEIIHTEGIYVSKIDRCKCLGSFVTMTIRQVSINGNRHESYSKVLHAVEYHWPDPGILNLERPSKTEE